MYNQIPLEQRQAQIAAAFQRMAQVYKVKVEHLHESLGCSAELLRQHYFHGQMPIELIRQCREEQGISIDWLVYGKSPSDNKPTAEQLDSSFCQVTHGLLLGLSKGENVEDYWHSLRCALIHRAMRLRREHRRF